MPRTVLAVLMGYLLGSVPFAYLCTRLFTGKDIRHEGEGNVGTRNVIRVAGLGPGLLTFAGDAGKGLASCWVCRWLDVHTPTLYLTGCATLLGHGFPVWLGWRGGKGLATAFGFILGLWPYAALAALAVLLLARPIVKSFDGATAVAAVAGVSVTFWEGGGLSGAMFVAGLLGLSGLKKLVDLRYERATRAASGWIESNAAGRSPRGHS